LATPTIVVFEKQPHWEPELQRQFLGTDVRVRACRATADVLSLLPASGQAVLLLDLEAGPPECLQFLGRWVGRMPAVAIVVVASPRTAELEWPIRELGSLEFLAGFVSGEEMARLCRRQFTPTP
jgi:hypothetical protein